MGASGAAGPGSVRNVLFIMCDQLRHDYLGYAGHPYIETPVIDGLARRGVNFDRAFVQAPVCGGSRMSTYTGRYAFSHGAHYNNFPLRIDEWTLGDYLEPLDVRTILVGKTHVKPDVDTLARLGIELRSDIGQHLAQGGFEPFDRDDGLHPDQVLKPDQPYIQYLQKHGYDSANPWHDFANSAEGPDGEILSGWHMRNAGLPARVREEHSETAYITDQCIDLIRALGEERWCIHLSYIKPHWPYMAPAPYHEIYANQDIPPPNRTEAERTKPHPVVGAFMQHEESENFARDEVRETVIPTYAGLIKQLDDHLGRLFVELETLGRLDDTLIVFTSDHGDYLGDHWLGEKDLFHEEIVRVPLLVVDPRPAADVTRGTRCTELVEAIDLIPTFIDCLQGDVAADLPLHRLEGYSLQPLLHDGEASTPREAVFCDSDYALRKARLALNRGPDEARAFMVRTERYKYIAYQGFSPQLFDLEMDPFEQWDLAGDEAYAEIQAQMHQRLFDWMASRKLRTTMGSERVAQVTGKAKERGYLFGVW